MSIAAAQAREAKVVELEERAASLAGVIAAATAAQVQVIAEALKSDLWAGWGIVSPEHWVALRCGVSPTRARRLVAAARALDGLPLVREAFDAGELTEDHVAEIVRAGVGPTHDDQALELAKVATVTQLRRGLSALPQPESEAEPEPSGSADEPIPAPAAREQVSFGFGDDGRWRLHAVLEPDRGALVEKALWAGRDTEFRARHPDAADDPLRPDPGDVTWVDGLVRLAHAGLDGLDPATADGGGALPGHRYQVLIHVDADTTASRLHLGPTLRASSRRLLSCDATVRAWLDDAVAGVGLGRRHRVVDPKLRTVVELRDGGCAVPGCAQTRWLAIHHLQHWEDGGETETPNLLALCGRHHRAVHHGELVVAGNPDQPDTLRFTDRRGRPIGPSPPRPPETPLAQAVPNLGIDEPRYQPRSGERADWRWLWWRDLPGHGGVGRRA